MSGRSRRRAVVVAATPTPNGDLHIGHMAGPYLAGDVYSRYLAADGRDVIYTTCTDDSQTYVTTTARRLGVSAEQLCAESTAKIERSISAMGLSMEGLPPIDDRYRATVLQFFTRLHETGRLRERTVRLPYAQESGRYLYDGLMTGSCPVCLTGSAGGVCEGCGHPNNADELLGARSVLEPDSPVTTREVTILVLPMEEYRERLTSYFDERLGRWRPHAAQLVRELLARPLPEIPVTVPGDWGIAAPFPETPGQILYPWVEAMPAVMYSTWWSADRRGERTEAVDELWRADSGTELVYFHGFDNVYHWGLLDLVLLMAHGDRYVLPEANISNEFYDLEGEKFSTSRNHLIWSADLLAEVPRDLVRFYLALTAPEFQRTDFSTAALTEVTERRLIGPWNRLAEALDALAPAGAGSPLPTTATGRDRAAGIIERFRLTYELDGFNLGRSAENVVAALDRLAAAAQEPRERDDALGTGDLLLQVRALLACAAPLLIDAAAEATAAGVDLALDAEQPEKITPFALPRLPRAARAGAARTEVAA
ncbi:class I tRNA ligase family protein [Streptomyces chartreusis]|uniref:Class I tRNA ligase family protein n=1 Tax=Streptomyces chartreusis TaxID=1969 RepID=A0A7H8TD74_STRCX|nr:class I tRNA ligase family protein [Streptomyces chartreusis]QKZ19970.1 class I tRNA ligase family protein [Streptomyces chartreusis]